MSKQNKNPTPSTANQKQNNEQNRNPPTGTQINKKDRQFGSLRERPGACCGRRSGLRKTGGAFRIGF